MALRLGDTRLQTFTAETSEGKVEFHKWLGDKLGDLCLFSPCGLYSRLITTELGTVCKASRRV